MRDARYVCLISWISRVVVNSLFLTGTKPKWTWTEELAERNGQGSNGNKRMGIQVVSKVHANRQDKTNLDNGIKRMGIQVVSRVTRKTVKTRKS
jgi:hypothetical protein